MRFLVIIFALVAVICAYPVQNVEQKWAEYKQQYGKNYDPKEDAFRMDLFRATLEMVEEHNKKYAAGEVTFEMGLNDFADWTFEEKQHLFGVPINSIEKQWSDFKTEFGKTYEPKEDAMRKEIFQKNLEKIEAHNQKYEAGEVTYEMGLNNFSDWTPAEIEGLLGYSAFNQKWNNYKSQFDKSYSEEEDAMRKELFRETFDMIEAHNKKYEAGEVTYKMGLNQFSDWTAEEKQKLFGFGRSDSVWDNYKEKYGKAYSPEEDSMRKEIFTKTLETIEAHNKKYAAGEVTWTMGLNQFSDWTPEELKHL